MDFLGGRRRVGRPLKLYIEYSKKERLARVGRPLKLNTPKILSRGGKKVSVRGRAWPTHSQTVIRYELDSREWPEYPEMPLFPKPSFNGGLSEKRAEKARIPKETLYIWITQFRKPRIQVVIGGERGQGKGLWWPHPHKTRY